MHKKENQTSTESHYIPCLRWKQGEYQALLRLSDATKIQITPLIEVPEIGWDFENKVELKTLDEHLSPFAKRVRSKWQQHRCFVDLKLINSSERMADKSHPVKFIFSSLRKEKCFGIPVTGIDRNIQYQSAVQKVVSIDGGGACIRITVEQAAKPKIKSMIDELLSNTRVPQSECDFILDLGAPNFIPLPGFCKVIQAIVQRLPYLQRWRTFTILGTSFPRSMVEIKGSEEVVPRHEWLLYKMLIANLNKMGLRLPTFGDYAISHPEVLRLDMRLVKPAASIRYTIDDAWYIIKGPNVRDNGFNQYHGHCQKILASPNYAGTYFSEGDKYISDCASRDDVSTGNLTTWRWIGTNHHLAKVVLDISNFFASLNNV